MRRVQEFTGDVLDEAARLRAMWESPDRARREADSCDRVRERWIRELALIRDAGVSYERAALVNLKEQSRCCSLRPAWPWLVANYEANKAAYGLREWWFRGLRASIEREQEVGEPVPPTDPKALILADTVARFEEKLAEERLKLVTKTVKFFGPGIGIRYLKDGTSQPIELCNSHLELMTPRKGERHYAEVYGDGEYCSTYRSILSYRWT